MFRTLTTVVLATALLAGAGAADAQDTGASGDWSFALGAATDNRSKDASKSDGEGFVWGQAQWNSASGLFYAGPSFETVRSSTGSELEMKASAGVRPQLAGFDLDLNAAFKYQIDANPGADNESWEFTADAKRSIGPASGRLRLQYSPDSIGSTKAWTWVEARVGWDFTDRLQGTASIGRREQQNSVDYTGWNAGLAYAVTRDIEFDVRYHATDAKVPGEQYANALVAGISFAF